MHEVKWVKLTTDMFDNRKIKHIRRLPDGNNIVLIWVMLLTIAGRCNAGGNIFLTENIPYDVRMLSDELDFKENTVSAALKALEQLDMIATEGGFIKIVGWGEHQNVDGMDKVREQTRKRVAEYKKNKKLRDSSVTDNGTNGDICNDAVTKGNVTDNVTDNAAVTQGNATEEEREKEREKEFHSFTLSPCARADKGEQVTLPDETDEQKRTLLGGSLGEGVVMLSGEQMTDLLERLSLDEFNHYVGIVRDCELNGKKFKSKTHYQAILDMAKKDRKIQANAADRRMHE